MPMNMLERSRLSSLSLLGLGLLMPAIGHASERSPSVAVDTLHSESAPRAVALHQTPLAVHRRAMTLLQNARGREDSRWHAGSLAPEVVPVWRPDKPGVAYWEFRVLDEAGGSAGYMVLANDRDDYPAPIWADDGLAPSEELAAMAGEGVARLSMPTVGTFVAEDEQGQEVARLGELPPRIDGYDPSWIDEPEGSFHTRVEARDGDLSVTPARLQTDITLSPWPSWETLTQEYAEAYAPQLELLRRQAADDWAVEDLLATHGEVLLPGHARVVPLLERGRPEVTLHGEGLAHVRIDEVQSQEDGRPALRVLVDEVPAGEPRAVDIELRYPGGEREMVRYMVARTAPEHAAAASAELASVRPSGVAAQVQGVSVNRVGNGTSCIRNGGRIAFRTHNGRFLFPRGNGALTAHAQTPEHAVFRLEQQAGGTWALRAETTNKYMVAEGAGGRTVNANRDRVGAWERFRFVVRDGGTKVAIRAPNGQYVVAEGGGGGDVNANRDRIGSWEQFTIACEPGVNAVWTGGNTRAASWAAQRKYRQIASGTAPNTDSQCSTGCGPTAWAMLIGWSDLMASRSVSPWTPHWGLYRRNGSRTGPDAVAPERNDAGVDAITIELRSYMNDWAAAGCGANGRWTAPHIMAQAHQYFSGRAATSLTADYDGAGISTNVGVRKAVDAIRMRRRPVIIGTGHFAHYPVAFGLHQHRYFVYDRNRRAWLPQVYRERFEANWGWGQDHSRNVPTSTWFQGFLHPDANKRG
jgi:hypothetical protein